ncbi:hypothetical protein Arub01_41230 [Actinomadura rubrobrunea]|uniref:Uncharacterized protein n=1 Tax=Actinomadura rubrobrunea TaxID=115335 RepID=A0A9W6PWS3_9ACTN|nr:hypothetical protein [Actinomadura rubrobrunea]GLW65879.1 hypothetical protein Arub01_41230 [Actinomadura rubrobrunea]
MRLRGFAVVGTALIAAGLVCPVSGQITAIGARPVLVSPSTPRPGQRVDIAVPGCTAAERRWARSAAFTGTVALGGEDDLGVGTAVIRRDARPGLYDVTARCGGRTIVGGFKVSTKRPWTDLLPTPLNAQIADAALKR